MTVAVSGDREFSAGDVVVMIGDEQLDTSAKMPVRDLLLKHGPNEVVQVKLRRADKELTVSEKCSDAKPVNDLLLEAAFAASKNDAATCADKMDAAARLHVLNHGPRALAYRCYLQDRRFLNLADNTKAAYDLGQELILENAWSSDALSNVRGTILSTVDWLQKNNASLLGNDLKQQYDQAVSIKSSQTATVTAGR